MSAHAALAEPRALGRRLALGRVGAAPLATVAFAMLLAAVAFHGGGGLQLAPLTRVEMALDLLAGVTGAAAILAGGHARRAWGAASLAVLTGLVVLTAASILWAVEPTDAWIETNRTLAWCATFALGIALVRLAPERWDALLGGLVLASVVVCAYALLTKVFPGALNGDELVARLREPFGYWNSVGLVAAMAAPACLWLGARRSGHAAVNALAYPALGLVIVALLLAYSRGSLLALSAGCALWFATVPLRLRGVAVLATAATGAGLVALWAFGQDALSRDRIALHERAAAGHELGILLIALVVGLLVAGLAIGFALARRAPAPATRHQAGLVVLIVLAMVPVVVAGALALSERGLSGSVSKAWTDLTDPAARTPANDPTRLAAVGSVRARYWNEALKMWRVHRVAGVGAGGYRTVRPRFRQDTLNVRHAHGYVVQTLADLGLAGLAVSLVALGTWLLATARTTGLLGTRRRAFHTPERIGLLSLLAIVVVFGVHSFVDWTWFVPGNAVPALLVAGWLAGRGPVDDALDQRSALGARLRAGAREPLRGALALGAVAVALVAVWATWQPQRSVDAGNDALEAFEARRLPQAREQARAAREINPLAVDRLYEAATIEAGARNLAGARSLYERAALSQPANPEPWLRLAQFELYGARRPRAAIAALGPALFLDPRSPIGVQTYLDATRQAAAGD